MIYRSYDFIALAQHVALLPGMWKFFGPEPFGYYVAAPEYPTLYGLSDQAAEEAVKTYEGQVN